MPGWVLGALPPTAWGARAHHFPALTFYGVRMGIQKSNFNVIQEHLQETSVKKHGLFFAITNPRKFAAHDAVTEDKEP